MLAVSTFLPSEGNQMSKSSSRFIIAGLLSVVSVLLIIGFSYYKMVYLPHATNLLKIENDCRQVTIRWHSYHAERGVSPSCLEDLVSYKPGGFYAFNRVRDLTTAYSRVESGELILVWNAQFFGEGVDHDKYILGYEKDVPTEGGIVMLGGGSVEIMTPSEFKKLQLLPVQPPTD